MGEKSLLLLILFVNNRTLLLECGYTNNEARIKLNTTINIVLTLYRLSILSSFKIPVDYGLNLSDAWNIDHKPY